MYDNSLEKKINMLMTMFNIIHAENQQLLQAVLSLGNVKKEEIDKIIRSNEENVQNVVHGYVNVAIDEPNNKQYES